MTDAPMGLDDLARSIVHESFTLPRAQTWTGEVVAEIGGGLYRFTVRTDDYGQGGTTLYRLSDGVTLATLTGSETRRIRQSACGTPSAALDSRGVDAEGKRCTYYHHADDVPRWAMLTVMASLLPVAEADAKQG